MKTTIDVSTKLTRMIQTRAVLLLVTTSVIPLPAQVLTTLHSFDGSDGSNPGEALVQALNGGLYGVAPFGGVDNQGTLFRITPSGNFAILKFCAQNDCADETPSAPLIQGTRGDLYGTADTAIFKTTPDGATTTVYAFDDICPTNEGYLEPGLSCGIMESQDGNFYGTIPGAGIRNKLTECFDGGPCGAIMKITPEGTVSIVYEFCPSPFFCGDGWAPTAPLVQTSDGTLYGITLYGGEQCYSNGCGTVFQLTQNRTPTTLHSFCVDNNSCPDGAFPIALILGTDGDSDQHGTVFKITTAGVLTTLHTFDGTDGSFPVGLLQARNGNFYGTTEAGGAYSSGTVFEMTPGGSLTTLYSFCSAGSTCPDGSAPYGGLVQNTDGNFYGTTSMGGASNDGTVFKLSVDLAPFVMTLLTAGEVGERVEILGTNLSGSTSVTFNGTAASFSVISKSLIVATIPAGASSGEIQVITPAGKLSSKSAYIVLP